MQKNQISAVRILLAFAALALTGCTAAEPRLVKDFDFDWKFARGDSATAMIPTFDDTDWRTVQVPHDWSIEGPFSPDNASGTGYLPGGVGWYRKSFTLDGSLRSRRIAVEFDGIYCNSDVWINGVHLGRRPFGYIGFQYDLTPHVRFDGQNVLAVRVDHSRVADSRWYTGSGIYRHVRLVITDPVHIAHWGTFVSTPVIEPGRADVRIQTDIANESALAADIVLISEIYTPDNISAARTQIAQSLAAGAADSLVQTVRLPDPVLWDVDNPALYTLRSTLVCRGKVIDRIETPFGIRSFAFDPDKGFSLNGRSMKLKGVCLHHDGGPLGAAVPAAEWRQRLLAMKEIGANAVRCSHNPPSPEFLDLCDRLGLLVIDEAFDEFTPPKKKWVRGRNEGEPDLYGYGEVFEQWSRRDIQDMVRRDRNHPAVILWSIGNEIDYPNDPFSHPRLGDDYRPQNPPAENLVKYGKPLVEAIKELDTTRPVTAAIASAPVASEVGFADILDVAGYNYQEQYYADHHARFPRRCLYGSENSRSLDAWLAVEQNDYIAGQFLWIGIDYLGEAGIWPMRSWTGGLFDLCLFKKPAGWFRQALWSDEPMVFLSCRPGRDESSRRRFRGEGWPHWNWNEGQTIDVLCYTNGDEAELFLNGRSLGTQTMAQARQRTLRWQVPFAPGTLRAVARRSGQVVSEYTLQTAGAPAALRLTCARTHLKADGKDIGHVEFEIVDENGIRIPDAEDQVTFAIDGPAQVIAVANGSPSDTNSLTDATHTAWQGRGLAVIRSRLRNGKATVTASAPGLKSATITLEID